MSMAYEFTDQLQTKILGCLWRDEKAYAMYNTCIQPRFFTSEVNNDLCRIIKEYYDKYKTSPTLDVVINEVGNLTRNSAIKKKLEDDYIEKVTTIANYKMEDMEYVKDKILTFGKRQALTEAVLESADIIEKGEDFGKVQKKIQDASLVGEDLSDLGVDYWENMEERIESYKDGNDVIERITTGSPVLDNSLNGGLGRSELGVIIAPPGRGKTTLLQNFGANAMLAGYNVAHIFFENNEKQILRNYDTRIVERTFDYMQGNTSKVIKALKMRRKTKVGKLKVKKFKIKKADANSIKSWLSSLKIVEDFVPDLIVIDYGTLMKSVIYYKEKRDEIDAIFTDIRELADEFDCPVWTAAQANRGSYSKKVVTAEDLAECFSIINTADVAIALCQSPREQVKQLMRYYLAKCRDNADHFQLQGQDLRDIKKLTIDKVLIDHDDEEDDEDGTEID